MASSPLLPQSSLLLMSSSGGGTAATPTTSNSGGSCSGSDGAGWSCSTGTTVSMLSATSGATLCYTNDGSSTPTASAGTCGSSPTATYSGGISITTTTTYKILASKSGMTNSSVLTVTYTISAAGITFVSKPPSSTVNAGMCPPNTGSPVNCTSFDTTGANWILAWTARGGPVTVGLTINGSSIGNLDCSNVALSITLCYKEGITGGPSTVLNMSGCNFCAWGAAAFSGMKTSGSYDGNLTSNSTTNTIVQPGSINPGAGNHLVITAQSVIGGSANSDVFTQDVTYVTLGFQPNGGLSPSSAAGYLIQTPNGSSTNPTATFSSSQFLCDVIASWSGV